MKRRILSVCTALCALVSLSGIGISSSLSSAADTEPVRILAMGDSITDGYINGDNGYRKYLCYHLQQQGFTNFDMVGPNNNWTDTATYDYNGTTITYDPAHAGYSGYAIQAMSGRSGIMETVFDQTYYGTDGTTGNMLEVYDPDMILLQIGTNDLLDAKGEGAPERLEELVDKIALYLDEGDVLFLASVPEIDVEVRNDWLGAYQWTYNIPSYADDPVTYTETVERCVDEYNAAVEALVEKKQAEGMNIRFADINSVVDMKTGLYDGVHPNEDGYACMGQYWSEQILAYLNGTEPVTTTTATEEQPTETVTETTTVSETVTTEETADTTTETSEETTETEITTDTQEPFLLTGDVTLDESINLADAVLLCHYLLGQDTLSYEAYQCADMTGDAVVNGFDLAALRQYLLRARGLCI
ncbi:MAG: GDSL-type esterase/lipase family protein [Ruminococcus sp.]